MVLVRCKEDEIYILEDITLLMGILYLLFIIEET